MVQEDRVSHTFVHLEVPQEMYDYIAEKLRAAAYHHAFGSDGAIDMRGIALVPPACETHGVFNCKKCTGEKAS